MGQVVLTEPSDPKFQLTAMMAGGRLATTRAWDPIVRILLVVAFAALVTTVVNRLEILGSLISPQAFAFFLGASASGLYFLSYAITSWRRSRKVHEQFANRGDEVRIVLGPDRCSWTARTWNVGLSWLAVDEVFDLPRGLGIRAGVLTPWVSDGPLPSDLDRDELKTRIALWREDARA